MPTAKSKKQIENDHSALFSNWMITDVLLQTAKEWKSVQLGQATDQRQPTKQGNKP